MSLVALVALISTLKVVSAFEASANKTCNMKQDCIRTPSQALLPCPDPMNVEKPDPTPYAPAPIKSAQGKSDLAEACPFLNPKSDLCCGVDTAAVMKSNYQSLDAVFFSDCPICATNLKIMWCEYACNPMSYYFLSFLGYAESGGKNMTEVGFNIDSDYACGLFQSCEQESFIAVADISSSIAFLDFLGVNGQNTSLSIITFNLTTDLEYPHTLTGDATPCDYPVSSDGILNSYQNIENSTCSFCAAVCEAPPVSSKIGLFDGFNGMLVLYCYIGFVAFTLIYQVAAYLFNRNRSVERLADTEVRDTTAEGGRVGKINNTISSS